MAVLEMLLRANQWAVPEDLWMVALELPDRGVRRLDSPPPGWNELPFSMPARATGDRSVAEGRSLAMMVPSVVLPGEWDVLVNPLHGDFGRVTRAQAEEIKLDPRLFR